MQQLIDLTVPLGPDTPLYPGDPPPEATLLSDIGSGDPVTASKLSLGAHIGTHVDLPAHFIEGGARLGDYAVEAFVGPAEVLDLSDVSASIGCDRLAAERTPPNRHLLLKTRNSALLRQPAFRNDYVFLEPEAAAYLLAAKPRSIGLDYYSLDPVDTESFPAHRACAELGLPVFVCLDLSQLAAGSYGFAGLPLNFPALEGVPVRAIAWRD